MWVYIRCPVHIIKICFHELDLLLINLLLINFLKDYFLKSIHKNETNLNKVK